MALVLVFLISALAVIYASHATRARYASLQTEQHTSDTLDEYEKLLLEQSVWAGYNRVDQLARETLQMHSPDQTNDWWSGPSLLSQTRRSDDCHLESAHCALLVHRCHVSDGSRLVQLEAREKTFSRSRRCKNNSHAEDQCPQGMILDRRGDPRPVSSPVVSLDKPGRGAE